MAHHAFFVEGNIEDGITAAIDFASNEYSLEYENNPDLIVLSYGLFSVDHARTLSALVAQGPLKGEVKYIVIAVTRLFHEAQNALLKLFEEPEANTVLVLVLPSEGMLLPTLRSRLLPLPRIGSSSPRSSSAGPLLEAAPAQREAIVTKLLDKAKSDNDEEKQAARREAIQILEGLMEYTYTVHRKRPDEELQLFLEDLTRFLPLLYERSAPLKQIFEHLLLVWPASLEYPKSKV